LHSEEISAYSSIIAKHKKVRLILKGFQKKFAKKFNRIAIEGRDISTKILNKNPRYDIAFFFKCNLNTAAYRRWTDLKRSNRQISLTEVKKSLKKRNELDVKRRFSPLIRSKDSIVIRTDILNKKAMVTKMSKRIDEKLIMKYGNKFKAR
jgi:cytidylate kinase